MRIGKCLAVLLLVACSRKKEPPPTATPTVESATAKPSASIDPVVEAPKEDAAADAPDDAVEADFVPRQDLVLPEGKLVNLGKFAPASKDAIKAHAAALQSEFESQVAQGCKEIGRFNASFVPATYVTCKKDGKPSKGRLDPGMPDEWRVIEVEGTRVNVRNYFGGDDLSGTWELWNTPRGYFLDVGDGRFTYVLRRSEIKKTPSGVGSRYECLGKSWSPDDGSVTDVKVPDYPTRGKDIDGDGKPEFPGVAFEWALDGFVQSVSPKQDNTCNVVIDSRMLIAVLGVDRGGDRPFFERRLRDARARAAKARKRGDVARKKGTLRFTNTCAIDLAQTAAEVFAYQRMLGAEPNDALVEADAIMKDHALKAGECGGLTNTGGDGSVDQWPSMRAALLAWTPLVSYAPLSVDAGVDAGAVADASSAAHVAHPAP